MPEICRVTTIQLLARNPPPPSNRSTPLLRFDSANKSFLPPIFFSSRIRRRLYRLYSRVSTCFAEYVVTSIRHPFMGNASIRESVECVSSVDKNYGCPVKRSVLQKRTPQPRRINTYHPMSPRHPYIIDKWITIDPNATANHDTTTITTATDHQTSRFHGSRLSLLRSSF